MPGSSDPTPPPRRPRLLRLLTELQRRRVPRVAAFYCVAAWLSMQVASVVFPALNLPPGAVTVVVVLAIMGFPLAVGLAWLFDLTPEGDLVPGAAADAGAPLDATAASRMALPIVLVVLFGGAVGWFVLGPDPEPGDPADIFEAIDARIAVLYFEDTSDGGDDARFLAAGLTEALIDELSALPTLRVISRNGVAPYRDSPVTIDSIARALKVDLMIGGTVTRAGDSIRVAVQISDAQSGAQLESLRLRRGSGEVFPLMDELVGEVTNFLRLRLGREFRVRQARAGTRSLEAWELLRRAEDVRLDAVRLHYRGNAASAARLLHRADSLAARAERTDPAWIEPHLLRGWVARLRAAVAFNPASRDRQEVASALADGVAHADAALELRRGDPRALELKGVLLHWTGLMVPPADTAEAAALRGRAETELRAAVAADAGRARAWSALSSLLYGRGDYGEARITGERALAADAYLDDWENILARLFLISFEDGDDATAGKWCDELTLRAAGRWTAAHCALMRLGWDERRRPDIDSAWAVLHRIDPAESPQMLAEIEPRLRMIVAAVIARAGLPDSARAVLQRAEAAAGAHDVEALQVAAAAYLMLGDASRAAALLEDYLQAWPARQAMLANSRRFAALHDVPAAPIADR
jgi:TolB-like protein